MSIMPTNIDGPVGDVNFTGMLNIYTTEPSPRSSRPVWHEYHLEFVHGSLKVIHCDQTGMALLFEHCEVRPPQAPIRTLGVDVCL